MSRTDAPRSLLEFSQRFAARRQQSSCGRFRSVFWFFGRLSYRLVPLRSPSECRLRASPHLLEKGNPGWRPPTVKKSDNSAHNSEINGEIRSNVLIFIFSRTLCRRLSPFLFRIREGNQKIWMRYEFKSASNLESDWKQELELGKVNNSFVTFMTSCKN